MISGELDDTEIFRAREFIKQYNQKWGERYVQFGIELINDRSKENSFLYGKYMYMKDAPMSEFYKSSVNYKRRR